MKRIIFFIGLLLSMSNLSAQKKVTVNDGTNGIDEVYVHAKFADDIQIKQWNKKEVAVEATVNINDNEDNDHFSLKVDNIGGTYTVKSDYGDLFKKRQNWSRKSDDDGCRCNNTMEIEYVIYIPKNMSLSVKSISGNAMIESYVGDLEIDFVSGDIDVKKHSNKMRLKTVSGDIDVVITSATFDASTFTGGIYSDLDIDFERSKKRNSGNNIRAKVNGGKADLHMKTVSGDIFLRKSS